MPIGDPGDGFFYLTLIEDPHNIEQYKNSTILGIDGYRQKDTLGTSKMFLSISIVGWYICGTSPFGNGVYRSYWWFCSRLPSEERDFINNHC